MPQRTLLDVTQQYLDATSGFYVDSIFDTDESQQVAKLAERVYYKMIQEYPNLLFTMKERTLDSLADTSRPNYMLLPKNLQKVQDSRIYYNVSEDETKIKYKEIQYLPPLEFADYMTGQQTIEKSIEVVGFDNSTTVVKNKQWPSFCTSYNNTHVIFDSYHSDYDTVLQSSKTKLIASSEPVFLQEDDFIIPIPESLTETYVDMVLDEAMNLIYQQPNAIIAQRARRARIKLQQDNRKMGQGRGKVSYGRKGMISSYSPRGFY